MKRLGYLPLAINEAAHYVASTRKGSHADFIADYEQHEGLHTTSGTIDDQTGESLESANQDVLWNMCFNSFRAHQQSLFNALSFFDPTGVPLDLIHNGARQAKGDGSDFWRFLRDEQRIETSLDALTRQLMRKNDESGHLWMHQIHQASAQTNMSIEQRQASWSQAVALMDGAWPVAERKKRRRSDLWDLHTLYLPHIQSLLYWFENYKDKEITLRIGSRFLHLLIQAAR